MASTTTTSTTSTSSAGAGAKETTGSTEGVDANSRSRVEPGEAEEPRVREYYTVLGVPPTAPAAQIRQAYLKAALRLHPDKNPGKPEVTAQFQKLQKAYSVLSDPVRRAEYDAVGDEDEDDDDGPQEEWVPPTVSQLEELIAKLSPGMTLEELKRRAEEERRNLDYEPSKLRLWTKEILTDEIKKAVSAGVTAVDFSGKSLTLIVPDICLLSNIHTLRLARNELSALPPEFSRLSFLIKLDLSANKFHEFPIQIVNMPLLFLDLSHNQLEVVPDEVISLIHLKEILFFGNQLSQVSEKLALLPNLERVDLECNSFSPGYQLPTFPSSVSVSLDMIISKPSASTSKKTTTKSTSLKKPVKKTTTKADTRGRKKVLVSKTRLMEEEEEEQEQERIPLPQKRRREKKP